MTDASAAESLAALHAATPMRVLLQVALAATFAALHGVKDARMKRPSRFWSATSAPMLYRPSKDLWPNLGKLLLLGLSLDAFFQALAHDLGSALEAVAIALAVALPLYLILRALIAWTASKLRSWG